MGTDGAALVDAIGATLVFVRADRTSILVGAGALVLGVAVLLLVRGALDDDEPSSPGPVTDDAAVVAPTTSTWASEADESVAEPARELIEVPIAVAAVGNGQLLALDPQVAPSVLVDDLAGRTVQAVTASGEVLLTPTDRWFAWVEFVSRDGALARLELPSPGSLLNQDGTLVEIGLQPGDEELGDIVRLDLASGSIESITEDVLFLSQNLLPVARAGGVLVEEYGWLGEYELVVTGADGSALPSPTDGRYGPSHGLRFDCPGDADAAVDTIGPAILDRSGQRLAWVNEAAGRTGLMSADRDLRVLRLSDGVDGSMPIGPDTGPLVGLKGDWAVFASAFVNLVTGDVVDLPAEMDVVVAVGAGQQGRASIPADPIPPPACPDGGVSIYGLRDLVVGQPVPDGVLTEYWEREPGCWLRTTDTGSIAVHLDDQGGVVGVVVDDPLEATPSGFRLGSAADAIVARFEDRIVVSPEDVEPAAADALDFVPADPTEADLGLRFVLRDGTVRELWAGDRAFTRSGDSCLL